MTVVFPVIHYTSDDVSMRNAEIVIGESCPGLFLIEMSGRDHLLPDIAKRIKERWPHLAIGLNNLSKDAYWSLDTNIDLGLDMTWVDNCGVLGGEDAERGDSGHTLVAEIEDRMVPSHSFFAAVAFKYQKLAPKPLDSARRVADLGWIVTTSGDATGSAPAVDKITSMKRAIGDRPLAVASGITPDNIRSFGGCIDYALVATGIGADFWNIDAQKLRSLVSRT